MRRSIKNKIFLPVLAILLTGVLLTTAGCNIRQTVVSTPTPTPIQTNNSGQQITPQDAKAMLAKNPAIWLLDVRTAEEYAAGHIPGSKLMPYDTLESFAAELPADRQTPIIVYCRSGRRSALAAETLAKLGYARIYDLGGIQNWPYEIVKD